MILSVVRIVGVMLLIGVLNHRGWSFWERTIFLIALACVFAGVEYQ